ncbi:hypothetical protein [Agromyces bauzanensis]
MKLDDLITRAQFAEMIGKSPTRVSQMLLKQGNDLPEPIRLGRDTMWVRQEAEEYAAAHPPASSSKPPEG